MSTSTINDPSFLKFTAVTSNSDTVEGRGSTVTHAYFADRKEAIAVVRDPRFGRFCTMGQHSAGDCERYNVREVTLPIYDTAAQFWEHHDVADKRKRALAKLTAEERELLGLK